jgi:hypothetical protein
MKMFPFIRPAVGLYKISSADASLSAASELLVQGPVGQDFVGAL